MRSPQIDRPNDPAAERHRGAMWFAVKHAMKSKSIFGKTRIADNDDVFKINKTRQ